MKVIKRMMTTLTAQIDEFVGQVENHEAVASAAIWEFQGKVHQAKVQCRLLEKEVAQGEKKRTLAQDESALWKKRAQEQAKSDHSKALQCARRYKASLKEEEFWATRLQELNSELERLQQKMKPAESKLETLKLEFLKHTSRDKISQLTVPAEDSIEESISAVFDRWDRHIIQSEVATESKWASGGYTDPLQTELEKEEENIEVEMLLKELTDER